MVRADEKCSSMTFIEADISTEWDLRMMYTVMFLNVNILETVRAVAQKYVQ